MAEMIGQPKTTLASAVYEKLREEIIIGSILPDTKVNIRALTDRLQVGLSSVREALNRLSSEGLVKQTDRRGFSVMPVSDEELTDLTRTRCRINELALRESIRLGDLAWEEALILSYHRMMRTPREAEGADRNPYWEQAHRKFHHCLIAGCGSNWLTGICEQLFEATERYRHIARIAGASRPSGNEEHEAIMNATIDRRAEDAVNLLNAHFEKTANQVRKVLSDDTKPKNTHLEKKRRKL